MKIHQNYIALATAAGVALLVLVVNMVTRAPDGALRMGYAAALYLISRDTLAGARIAKGPRRFSNPDRWILAFYSALTFGTFMLLALWRGMDGLGSQLMATAAGSLIFGVAMAFFVTDKPYPYAHHFQTENPTPRSPVRRFFYYATPWISLMIVWVLVQNSPLNAASLFFYIILMGYNNPRYKRKSNGSTLWAYFPMIIGYALLVDLFLTFR